MADDASETNKSEEATPFKLQRAREKGSVARGVDLSFFAVLLVSTAVRFQATGAE